MSMKAAHSLLCVALLRCVLSVSLRVEPNRCLFVRGEPVSFSCEGSENWTVVRNITWENFSHCGEDWGRKTESGCRIRSLIFLESGLYWCEGDGHHSAAVNITVTDKLEPNQSTACAPVSTSSTSTTTTTTTATPTATPTAPAPQSQSLWAIVSCSLVLILVQILVLLMVKSDRGRTEQNGRPDETTCCELQVSHGQRRPINQVQELDHKLYTTVVYSITNQTRRKT